MKETKGKGPQNIFIKYLKDEFQVVMQGHISEYEKYLIKNFGQEAVALLTDFHERDIKNVEESFNQYIDGYHYLEIYKIEIDFINDIFVWKIRVDHSDQK